MTGAEDSPVLARAPLLLSESLLFPYREGLSFEQDVWMDQGQAAAFTGTLDRPPTSSWEIINPREYEKKHMPSVPLLPNIHPLVDPLYKPYDIGQVGQLDVRILTELFGGDAGRARPDPGLGWRPLLGRPAAQRQDPGRAGQHKLHRHFLSLGLEERRLRAGLRPASMRMSWAANTPACSWIDGLAEHAGSPPPAPPRSPEPISPGAGLLHQRRPGGDHHARQAGLRRRELPARSGPQARPR